ncbi:MAG: hypothetical protein AVDCRST_MAG87-3377 [uncultured Thermomicrobiales bacterium]|uniref:Uncharacterized protein n=1 Tax=uncultured Thermomicrobiales bacterium TaxID=1645740 RepID=A0A6J4VM05_9BACT|nr:MAG: hypothetical protein AVDCRST_MAG87-3377 [uncultured Thermomicrobiales bacterium]
MHSPPCKDEGGGRVGVIGQDHHVPSIPAVEGTGHATKHGTYGWPRRLRLIEY